MNRFYTIEQKHVGKGIVDTSDGKRIHVHSFMGRVLPCDVGKRLYFVGGIWQVENDEQRARRLAHRDRRGD